MLLKKNLLFIIAAFLILALFGIKACKKKPENTQPYINFNQVDLSPQFQDCKNSAHPKECFQLELSKIVLDSLKKTKLRLKTSSKLNDTIWLMVKIDTLGAIQLDTFLISSEMKNANPTFIQNTKKIIASFPQIKPAIRRGIPVTSIYKLPLLLRREE